MLALILIAFAMFVTGFWHICGGIVDERRDVFWVGVVLVVLSIYGFYWWCFS